MANPTELLRLRDLLEEVAQVRGLYARAARRLMVPARTGVERFEEAGMRRSEGGSGIWLSITIVVWTLRLLVRLSRRRRDRVFAVRLEPGQQLQIRHLALDRAGRTVRVKA